MLDWKNLSFDYIKTNGNVRAHFKDGAWGELKFEESGNLNLHIASTCLHYGQTIFEGLKAFRGKDGEIRIFRLEENAKRMAKSAQRLLMPEMSEEMFKQAVIEAVEKNKEFVPPYESGATLYIRPLMLGVSPLIKVNPATEYIFIVLVSPVGPYFKSGFATTDVVIERNYDRAAPLGTGTVKMGGNYSASLQPLSKAVQEGFATAIFLDAKEKKYIDECGQANLFGIKENKYITPKSTSILESITNKSLKKLAQDMGLEVEERQVEVAELAEFEELGACGTAAVITPIKKVVDRENNKTYEFGEDAGKTCTKLYNQLRAIQYGDAEDKYNWNTVLKN